MNNNYVLFALQLFSYYFMKNASDLEIKLTIYILATFLDSPKPEQFLLKDELLFGHELFDDSGKRIKEYLGIGVTEKELETAIDEVNERNLIQIKGKKASTLLVKLNLKHIKDVSKQIYKEDD